MRPNTTSSTSTRPLARQERGHDDEQHGGQIERQQPVAKADGIRLAAVIQLAQPPMQCAVLVLALSASKGWPRTLRCTRSSKRATLTTTRWCVPSPITSRSSRASTRNVMVRPSTRRDLRRRRDGEAHRRRREVAHVEVDAEALMSRRQQVLHRRQRGRLDHVDHHRRRQHRDPPRADARRRVLRRHHEFGGAGQAGADGGEVDGGHVLVPRVWAAVGFYCLTIGAAQAPGTRLSRTPMGNNHPVWFLGLRTSAGRWSTRRHRQDGAAAPPRSAAGP